MKNSYFYIITLLILSSLAGCRKDCRSFRENEVRVNISSSSSGPAGTRSSISPSEDQINDYSVFIYQNGRLVHDLYSDSDNRSSVVMHNGQTYHVYALANMGDVIAPEEEAGLQDFRYSIQDVSGLEKTLPMAQDYGLFTVSEDQGLDLVVSRLASKVSFSLDALPVTGLEICSVSLHQAPLSVRPFAKGGNRAAASEVADGDQASDSDISALNNGGSIRFYVLENMQGTLLPGNTDPWNKVPDRVTGSEACTYVEAVCRFDQATDGREGSVTYRFYLGKDNVTNFDIERNTLISVSLTASEANLKKVSWKIQSDYIQHVRSVALDRHSDRLFVNGTVQLNANVKPADSDDISVLWESSDPKIASVSETGKVTALKPGTCTITARSNDRREISDQCTITVENLITTEYRFFLSGYDSVVAGHDTETYKLCYYTDIYTNGVLTSKGNQAAAFAGQVSWSVSSGASFGSISSSGVLHGIAKGSVTIKATADFEGSTYWIQKEVKVTAPSGISPDTGWEEGGSVEYK